MLRRSHILFFICVFGLVSLCLTNGFADDDGAILEGDPFEFPTAEGPEYIQGSPEFLQRASEFIIGTPDFEKMRDLPTDSQDYSLGRKVGWIIIPTRSIPNLFKICTGFLVGPDLFMTNHHCLHDNLGLLPLGGTRIYMDYYQEPSVDRRRGGITARVSGVLRMDAAKDYALLRLNSPIGNTYGWLELDTTTAVNTRQSVKLIHHADGRSKEISRRNSQIVNVPSDLLARDPRWRYMVAYLADTQQGTSGSPVFLRDGTGVIAIHHSGWYIEIRGGVIVPQFNAGTLMSYIVPEIQQWLPGGSPPSPTLTATTLEVVSGDGQSARAGSQIANPLVVRVRDQNSDPMSGVSVSFSVTPSGQVTPSSATTGTNGEAQTRLTLGSTAGTYTVTARATGITQPVTFTATGTTSPPPRTPPPNDPISFDPSTVADQTFTVDTRITPLTLPLVTGGTTPYTYTLSPIPAGLSFTAASRTLSGTPTTPGTTTATYTATDANEQNASLRFTITVTPPPLTFKPATIANQTFTVDTRITPLTLPLVTGGTTPYTYTLSPIPAGLSFTAASRTLSGTPTTPGTTTATYTATDANEQNASLTFTITVTPPPLTFNPATIANQTFTTGTAVNLVLPIATGGTAPYTYTLSPIPAGLSFTAASRTLNGTPTTPGTTTATYTATDASRQNVSLTFTVRVIAPLTIPATIDDQTFTVGTPINLILPLVTGGTAPYTYTLSPIPAGLAFESAKRELSGTPTTPGTTTATYTATDASRQNVSLTFTITVLRVDVNGDGVVDVVDLTIAALAYGTRVPAGTSLPADVNSDGVVNLPDLILVAQAIDAAGVGATAVSLADIAVALEAVAAAPNAVSGGNFAYRNVTAALADARLEKGIPETVLKTLQRLLLEMRAIPETTALLPNYPNPFNPETWIPYHLAKATTVKVTIYTVKGEVVRELTLGHQAAGVYVSRGRAAYWDGKNESGEPVASGLYFYTLSTESTRDSVTSGDFTATGKMLIRK